MAKRRASKDSSLDAEFQHIKQIAPWIVDVEASTWNRAMLLAGQAALTIHPTSDDEVKGVCAAIAEIVRLLKEQRDARMERITVHA